MARTAKEISTQELRSYHPWLTMERHRKDPEVSRRREGAWRVARVVAETLKSRYGATRVVVFGSLARKTGFTPWSGMPNISYTCGSPSRTESMGTST